MSPSSDRIAAPTNGHQRASSEADGPTEQATATQDLPERSAGQTPEPAPPRRLVPVGPGRVELPTGGPTAGQVAIGFAILAGLIVIALGRRRGPRG